LWPYSEDDIKTWRVSDKLGNIRNNWAELIDPVPDDTPKSEKKTKRATPSKEITTQGLFD
jgi:hypothetical protein